jgi:hypothetical protein
VQNSGSKLQVLAHRPGGLPIILERKFVSLILLLPVFYLAAALMLICKARKPDPIHAQWAPIGILARLTGLLLRRPVITTFRGAEISWGRSTVWLLIRRTLGDDPQYSYFISNASSGTRQKTLVWLSGLRWAIKQCFEEAKNRVGNGSL